MSWDSEKAERELGTDPSTVLLFLALIAILIGGFLEGCCK